MNLDKKIAVTDYATLFALAVTLVAALFAFYLKDQQAKLLKAQRQKDVLAIAEANEKSKVAEKDAEIAKKDAAFAFENAAKSNEKAANAELRSKELEKQLLKLRLAVSDRFLPDFVKEELAKKLKNYASRQIEIRCNISNNNEPINFSNALGKFFTDLGWHTKISDGRNVSIPAPTGIKILVSGRVNLEIAKIIKSELDIINYQCDVVDLSNGNDTMVLLINAK